MDTQPSVPISHPLRPYSIPATRSTDDFSWSNSSSSSSPSLRYPESESSTRATATTLDGGLLLKAFVTSSLLSFTGVALVQPFEVGKTLCQVQWVPKRGVQLEITNDDDDDNTEVIQDEQEAETYFKDLSFKPPTTTSFLEPPPRLGRITTDPSGYLGPNDSNSCCKPEWVMPIVVQGGVWEMIKALTRWKGEGLKSLWKGQSTSFLIDTLTNFIQPNLLQFSTIIFQPLLASNSISFYNIGLPLIYSPKPLPLLILTTMSHTITSFLLSPLDLIKTRLIVQSSQTGHEKYTSFNPFSTLQTILTEEGGFKTIYLHPNLFYPTLFESFFKPFLHLSIPLLISRFLKIEPSTSPFYFASLELLFSCTSLLLTIPIETVRKRLQLQSRAEFVRGGRAGGIGKPWRSSVELRPSPVQGILECIWRILTEETGKLPLPKRRRLSRRRSSAVPPPPLNRSDTGMSSKSEVIVEDDDDDDQDNEGANQSSAAGGLRQLYRGLSMGIGANVVVFLLGLVAGGGGGTGGGGGSGWAEM